MRGFYWDLIKDLTEYELIGMYQNFTHYFENETEIIKQMTLTQDHL